MDKKVTGTFVDENIYNIRLYPVKLRPIVRVLMRYEGSLSDGFEWYGSVHSITKLAQSIYDIKQKEII